MYAARHKDKTIRSPQVTTPEPELDDGSIIDDTDDVGVDVDVDVDVVVDEVATQKPHFLDYDAVPPPDFEESFDRALSFGIGVKQDEGVVNKPIEEVIAASTADGELRKLDKKYERDGEISDYELAASGYTKKEFTQDDNTLHISSISSSRKQAINRPKHFLDENPIPPDYMLEHELREHRSLDRNFERQHEQQLTVSPPTSLGGGGARMSSLDRGCSVGAHSSRERYREPSYTLSRFLDNEAQLIASPVSLPPQHRLPKSSAWSDCFDNRYGSVQLQTSGMFSNEIDTLGPKVECVYSLLSMLGSNDSLEMSKKFLELSRTPETCTTLRRSGCMPLLVQMMHSEGDENIHKWAGAALHNVVHSNPDEKAGRREAKVLRLLDQIMEYCNFLKTLLQSGGEAIADDSDRHPLAAISSLMKVSFDEEHRHAMCELGALQAIPSLVHLDHAVHGPKPEDQCCNSLRRYALMALTNLTFGDENNKALLCSQKLFMEALVSQLDAAPDDLLQVTASVLRNLSWRADSNMKAVLNEIGTVTALAGAAMKNKSENTLKAILSALWNLSAHCSTNKAEFCAVDGALAFLVDMLTYEGPSKTLKIIENAGGILRNVSSHIAVREHYRQILRERNCLSILLQQLKSESLTVVSNSCGTLWNLSARCPEDQKFLWDNGAVPMLRSLINSKHAMISEGSSSALKNLLNFRPSIHNQNQLDPIARSMGLKKLPTLNARKQKALEQELGEKEHAETCDNLDIVPGIPKEGVSNFETSPSAHYVQCRYPLVASGVMLPTTTARLTRSAMLTKSESRDSVLSAKSDSAYENLIRSHSASDDNRCSNTQKLSYAAVQIPRLTVFTLENHIEPTEEQPIDYSVKYNEDSTKRVEKSTSKAHDKDSESGAIAGATYATYQETDLDQPTDFSLRYAENQIESDVDISPPEPTEVPPVGEAGVSALQEAGEHMKPPLVNNGNAILLILEDSVKCYQTEDTPYVISNAASVTDLRQVKLDTPTTETVKPIQTKKYQKTVPHQATITAYGSGSYTPEKPVNYCEEGTPGYFSRYESLSSLDDSPPQATVCHNDIEEKPAAATTTLDTTTTDDAAKAAVVSDTSGVIASDETAGMQNALLVKQDDALVPLLNSVTNINSAQETPLMFSRHSSMDSLVEEDVGPCDDKSSVVSDFSRLASGVISPSEIPDSPTQSMPQSPRRNSVVGGTVTVFSVAVSPMNVRDSVSGAGNMRSNNEAKRPLRSVFEDKLNTFHVENTPAQFSCATSLSNLSIMDEEHSSTAANAYEQDRDGEGEDQQSRHGNVSMKRMAQAGHGLSEGEEEDAEVGANNDDLLLASCINIGMNRTTLKDIKKSINSNHSAVQLPSDEPKQYYTEGTPALLSKVGSNTNLSAISIGSSSNELKADTPVSCGNIHRRSALLTDDISSNASESGVAAGQTSDLLQKCIRDGMEKPTTKQANSIKVGTKMMVDPIAMMRRGGSVLPPYLPVTDEMSKYLVEDSPCNFSVMSGLSNLTVGSSLVGPAVQLKENASVVGACNVVEEISAAARELRKVASPCLQIAQEDVRQDPHWQDDSLSSLSIDSEDDTNLLSQAIAAGCNRPKSNLGFSTSASISKRSTSLSASQPIPINATTSTSSLNSCTTARNYQRQQQEQQLERKHSNGNESYSSVDSSDSNDNQSKSLLELCILTGMHKTRDQHNSRKQHLLGGRSKSGSNNANASTQSNPNLKQYDALAMPPQQKQQHTPNRHLRERERKDEKLLLECINTGITKKISGGVGDNVSRSRGELVFTANAVPKNGPATSAVVLAPFHPTAATTSPSVKRIAAPDVEKNNALHINTSSENETMNVIGNENGNEIGIFSSNSSSSSISISQDDTSAPKRQLLFAQRPAAMVCVASPQSLVDVPETPTNGIGCKEVDQFTFLDNITSDESNQSFIMETTVSLDHTQQRIAAATTILTADKHKDPDLMLKSVERLTLEFVTSAEQLRTNGCNDSANNDSHKRLGSISVGGSNSNNTWNDDTCPNDVSFPSVSVSAPLVASLHYDDEEDEDEQATETDHRELYDFAEITPTNEEQPPPSLGYLGDELDMYGVGVTQPNSLEAETETDTLVRDETPVSYATAECNSRDTPTSTSGINFQLGGEVQTAAAAAALSSSHLYFQQSAMTNSTIIAIEALALADNLNLQQHALGDENTELYSLSSLDLDNIRPPSGMESLNISGYYQELSSGFGVQPHSLPQRGSSSNMPQSPQLLSGKSPKFPRKLLPAGLVARRALGQLPGQLGGSAESVNSSCNLLDNIKPPSLMDELLDSMISVASIQSEVADCESLATTVSVSNYETAAASGGGNEFDDNTVTLLSCYDNTLPHDEDDGTPLPSDCDFSSAESTPRKLQTCASHGVKRSLTPKQKRKMIKDRFKTYTIAADLVLSEELLRKLEEEEAQQRETLQIEIVDTVAISVPALPQFCDSTSPTSSRQGSRADSNHSRRRSSQDRFKTQTIVYAASALVSRNSNDLASYEELAGANISLTSTDDCPSDEVSSIKAMTKQFQFISTAGVAAPLHAESDYTSLECAQNSETESCHGQFSEPENETSDNDASAITANGYVDQATGELEAAARPRITKPSDTDLEATAKAKEAPPTIRGRKKASYVSPYSMQFQRNNAPPLSRLASNKPLLTTSSNTHFRQRNGLHNTSPIVSKLIQKKKTAELTTNHNEMSPAPLERQGTFVQDQPTISAAQVPVVETVSSSAQSSPTKRTSKLPTKQRAATAAARKLPLTTTTSTNIKMRRPSAATTVVAASSPQRSNSNASIRVTSNAARIAVLSTRISTTTPPSRSNSNLSSGATQSSTATVTNKINAVQSRIAGIWKRVDEAHAKQQHQTQKSSSLFSKKTPLTLTSAQMRPRQPLIRNTICDNTPEAPALCVNNVPTTTTVSSFAAASKLVSHRNIATRSKEHIAARK